MNARHVACWSLGCMLAASAGAASPAGVLVETERFADRGGWVIDPQFMDQMGSPYLLAHGIGTPVKDASTEVALPAPGAYRVWARTMDWVARWKAPGAPGKFQVLVDGKPLGTIFGTKGAEWHWQDGGVVTVSASRVRLTLRDLTGFEGRCDALWLAPPAAPPPPNRDPEMIAWRRECLGLPAQPEDAGSFELVVTGGGLAGACAAIGAARLGVKTALIQDRPVLGGNNSSEVRVWAQGARNLDPWPRVGDLVAEIEPVKRAHYGPDNVGGLYEDGKKLEVARAETNLTLFLEHRANAVEKREGRIAAVIAQDIVSGRRIRVAGRWFADCTGDATVGFLAGADHEMLDAGHMGPCNLWNVGDTGGPTNFPRCPWALDLTDRPFPGRSKTKPEPLKLGGWYWESGFDHDPIDDIEYMRDWNFRAMYGAWDAMKNVDQVLPNYALRWSAFILGKRESRRLMGEVVLERGDLMGGRTYDDGCVPTGWKIDLHLPDPAYEKGFEGDAFISRAHFTDYPMPYWIPYRSLYSRNITNLFMAGRCISVTHEALGAVRVMRTGGCMGEIVGMAAAICKRRNADPRDVYHRYLPELHDLMAEGVGRVKGEATPGHGSGANVKVPAPPAWLAAAGTNLARTARVTASGTANETNGSVTLVNDGQADPRMNSGRWLSRGPLPQWIEFAWDKPVTLGAARLLTGYVEAGALTGPITDFRFQVRNGSGWKDVVGGTVADNTKIDWGGPFAPVTTDRLRLLVTKTPRNVARLWEVELYGPIP